MTYDEIEKQIEKAAKHHASVYEEHRCGVCGEINLEYYNKESFLAGAKFGMELKEIK